MPTSIDNNNTRQRVPITVSGYPDKVKDLLRTKYPDYDQVMGGGQNPMQGNGTGTPPPISAFPNQNFFQNNQVIGKFENQVANPNVQNGVANPTDFTQMPAAPQFTPQGAGNANPELGPVQTPYQKDAAEATPQNITNFEGMQGNQQQFTPTPLNGNEDVGYKGGPYDPSQYDSLSQALNGGGGSEEAPDFHADGSKRDGGFFGWLKKLMPKNRPGMREGETPDEYDRRMTTNRERLATLADAFRHLGNIINTAKGAPLQQFNDPTEILEKGYQNRKAQRQKQAAVDADAAYKQADMTLKERAAEADRNYKQLKLYFKQQADERAAKYKDDNLNFKNDEAEKKRERQAAQDKQKQENWQKTFDENTRHHKAQEGISASKGRGGSGGKHGGSGGKYWFVDKNGKMQYQPNKTMWEQEYYREYGKLPNGESSSSTSTKTIDKNGNEVTVTNRSKGSSMTAQAAAAQNAAQRARKNARSAQKSGGANKSKGKKGGGWASGFKI